MGPRWAAAGSAGCIRRACVCPRARPRGSSRRDAAQEPRAEEASPVPSIRAREPLRGTIHK